MALCFKISFLLFALLLTMKSIQAFPLRSTVQRSVSCSRIRYFSSVLTQSLTFHERKIRNHNLDLKMSLNCGIVGLPNVGKSTLFNALVGSEAAQAANFPFCTIG